MKRMKAGFGAIVMAALAPTAALAQSGAALRLFADTGFRGETRQVDRGVENLMTVQFGDKARSVIAEGRWEVCLDPGFAGGCRVVQGRVSDMGDWNARVSSVRYIGPSDWGAATDAGAGRATAPGATPAGAAGPVYRVDHRPELIGRVYATGFGELTLERYDRGGAAGRYAGTAADGSGAGRFEGVVQPAQDLATGYDTVEGYWSQTSADQRCDTARNGTYFWGRMQFNFLRASDDYLGFWSYCDGHPLNQWNGEFLHRDKTIGAAVDAQLAARPGSRTQTGGGTAGGVAGPAPAAPPPGQLPGVVDRTVRAAGEEVERRVQDRIREGIGRAF